ncbi:MAG: FHA domain-containing protein [Planctomycetota bacterium]
MGKHRIVVEDATGELLATEREVTFGTRGCDIVLDDPVAAARHCEVLFDGAFCVRDLGSVTGTWLGSERVGAPAEISDGAVIVLGASRLLAKVEPRDGVATLALQLQRNAFWWRKAGKKVFDNDPDALVRAEVGFGRFPALARANRFAMVAGASLLLGGTFLATVMEPLADAGTLLPSHAFVTGAEPIDNTHQRFLDCRKKADDQGCNVCHSTGAGTPAGKCLQCHGELADSKTRRHPYFLGPVLGDSLPMADEQFCVICHTDHQGQGNAQVDRGVKKPAYAQFEGKCEPCHGQLGDRGEAELRKKAAMAAADRVPPRPRPYSTIRFPHNVHVDQKKIDCVVCHRENAEVLADRDQGRPDNPLRDDFAEVPYETCAACHVTGKEAPGVTAAQIETWRPQPENQWPVTWHGSDTPESRCAACHESATRQDRTVFGPDLKMVERAQPSAVEYAASRATYTLPLRSHKEQFDAHAQGQECTKCHLLGDQVAAGKTTRTFWHALHLAPAFLDPGAGAGGDASTKDGGCLSCHDDMRTQTKLTAGRQTYHWPATEKEQRACNETCHKSGNDPLTLAATAVAVDGSTTLVRTADFPHGPHVASSAFGKTGSLQEGCFACHQFAPGDGERAFAAVPRTTEQARSCLPCHQGHADVGGGRCQKCHPAEPNNSFLDSARLPPGALVRGKPAPPAPTRPWPGLNGFSHYSRGHDWRREGGPACKECHDQSFVGAADLATVPVPDEMDDRTRQACRACHLKKQFHWR